MLLKDALDNLKSAFDDFDKAARSDDKTPLQNLLSLNEAKIFFATLDDSPNVVILLILMNLNASMIVMVLQLVMLRFMK